MKDGPAEDPVAGQEDERVSVPVDEREDADDVLAGVSDGEPAADSPASGSAATTVTDRDAGRDGGGTADAGSGDGRGEDSGPAPVAAGRPRGRTPGQAVELRADFGAHLEANYQRLVAQLYAITLDAGEAHDVVQDAYSRAWRNWATIGRSPDPAAWVRRVAVRSTVRSWRRTLARFGIGRAKPVGDGVEPRTRALLGALGRLNPGERRAVVLFHMAGAPAEEIAAIERVSAGIVQARLARARQVVTEGMADVLPAVLGGVLDDYSGDYEIDYAADMDDYGPAQPGTGGYPAGGYGTGGYALDPYDGSGGWPAGGYGYGGYEPGREDGGERR